MTAHQVAPAKQLTFRELAANWETYEAAYTKDGEVPPVTREEFESIDHDARTLKVFIGDWL